jgi:hypothetical protein
LAQPISCIWPSASANLVSPLSCVASPIQFSVIWSHLTSSINSTTSLRTTSSLVTRIRSFSFARSREKGTDWLKRGFHRGAEWNHVACGLQIAAFG